MNKPVTQLPVNDDHTCFACGPANPHGLHMTFLTDGEEVFSRLTVPDHLRGWNNMVHGGVISTILDEVMSWAAIHLIKSIIVTRTMRVDFLKPVFIGQQLKAVARISEILSRKEALLQGDLYNAEKVLCATARGSFALLKPKVAEKLGIAGAEEIRELLK
jgi:uncharacterized protein (TIGR00369 family)